MIERFRRNREKSADEDVAERVFAVFEDRIALTYHLEDQRITASTREFIKPPGYSTEKGAPLQLTPDTTHAFQVRILFVYSLRFLQVSGSLSGKMLTVKSPISGHHRCKDFCPLFGDVH